MARGTRTEAEKTFNNNVCKNIEKWRKNTLKKSAKDFSDDVDISYNIIRQRDGLGSAYSVFNLYTISKKMNVDVAFLMGLQEETKRETQDVKDVTGLSSDACVSLLEYLKNDNENVAEEYPGLYERINRIMLDNESDIKPAVLSAFFTNGLLGIFDAFIHMIIEHAKSDVISFSRYERYELMELFLKVFDNVVEDMELEKNIRLITEDFYNTVEEKLQNEEESEV